VLDGDVLSGNEPLHGEMETGFVLPFAIAVVSKCPCPVGLTDEMTNVLGCAVETDNATLSGVILPKPMIDAAVVVERRNKDVARPDRR
jgi:hypothetical protein